MEWKPDEGYYFGFGVFETIAVEEGKPVFLEAHMQRLKKGIQFFDLAVSLDSVTKEIERSLEKQKMKTGRKVLKITVSQKNIMVASRENTYKEEQYKEGFVTGLSKIRRNETSPLTYHKTLNYADNMMEKRRAKSCGIDEPIFLNTKGHLSEGATSNLFFVKNQKLYTPKIEDGILNGVMRQYLCSHYKVYEEHILPEEVEQFDEMFVTNSLLGIMPVKAFETIVFKYRDVSEKLRKDYKQILR